MRFLIIGPPGAGKGTIAAWICEEAGIPHISTGDIFRRNISQGTKLGKIAAAYIDEGKLVPDETTNAMVREHLRSDAQQSGFLLDGFPRTLAQAEALEMFLAEEGIRLDAVILIELNDEEIVHRLSQRRVCPSCGASYHLTQKPSRDGEYCEHCGERIIHRDDDKPATIRKRLEIYHEQSGKLIDYYERKDLIRRINNDGRPDEARQAVQRLLKSIKS